MLGGRSDEDDALAILMITGESKQKEYSFNHDSIV